LNLGSNGTKQVPNKGRMLFLSQPKKSYSKKKKKGKKKKHLTEANLMLPSIKTPSNIKNSLINLSKAKIYGVGVDKLPGLVEPKGTQFLITFVNDFY
jgi:hypothetical protein